MGTLSLGRVGGTIADTAAVQVSGGMLDVANADTVGAVTLSSGTITGAGTLTGSSYSLTNSGAISAILAGSGSLTKTGAGTATLSAVNTFGGPGQTVNLNGGNLQVSADTNLGNAANRLTFDGGTLLFMNGFSTTRSVTLNAGGGTLNTGNNAVTLATSGVISGSGALTKTGTGTLTLTGANTYSGGTILNAGALSITGVGNVGTGSVRFNNGTTLVTNGTFNFTNGFVLGAPGGALQADGLAVSGVINVQSGTLTQTTNGITDGGAGGRLMKIGAGTLDLQVGSAAYGGNTAFTGGLYIHEGTLIITTVGAAGVTPVITFDNGATFIPNLNVGGMVSVTQFRIGTGGALTGEGSSKTSFSNGPIYNVGGQAGGITFIGPGKSGMGGNITFVGTVTIGNPAAPLVPVTLSVSRDVNLGAASNQLTIGNGGTLMIEDGIDATQPVGSAAFAATFSTGRQINLTGSTATIDVRNTGDAVNYNPAFSPGLNALAAHVNVLTANGLITGPGQLIKAGPGTLVLMNTGNNYAGGTVINGGTLSFSNSAALGSTSGLLTINPTGILQATGSINTSRTATLGGTGGASSGGTFDVTGSNIETRTGVISGTGSLTKTGTGTLALTVANTFTGDLFVNGGTVSYSNSQALGPQPPSPGSPLYASTWRMARHCSRSPRPWAATANSNW